MKRILVILIAAIGSVPGDASPAQCSAYHISEISLVSVADIDAGNVHTFVGFGQTKEEAEQNAVSSCSRVRFDIETCVESDRVSARNSPSDRDNSSLHLKYAKAVRRITGCS